MSRLITNAIRSTSASADAITFDNSGKPAFPNGGAGKILQVIQTYKTDTFSASIGVGAETGDVTGLTVTITPSNANNKILVSFDLSMGLDNSSSGNRIAATLYRGGSKLDASTGDASGNTIRVTAQGATSNNEKSDGINGSFLESPSTTSATTYSLRLRHGRGATCNVYINRPGTMYDYNYGHKSGSSITLMEIAA